MSGYNSTSQVLSLVISQMQFFSEPMSSGLSTTFGGVEKNSSTAFTTPGKSTLLKSSPQMIPPFLTFGHHNSKSFFTLSYEWSASRSTKSRDPASYRRLASAEHMLRGSMVSATLHFSKLVMKAS